MSNCSPGSTLNPTTTFLVTSPAYRRKYFGVSQVQLRLFDGGFFLLHIRQGRERFGARCGNPFRPGFGILVTRLSLSQAALRFLDGLLSSGLICFCRSDGGDIRCGGGIRVIVNLLWYFRLCQQQAIAGDIILSFYIFGLRFHNPVVGGNGLLFCRLDCGFRSS